MLMLALLMTSCATILRKDTLQEVTFTTEPPRAEVFVDGKKVGTSPLSIPLETTEEHSIEYKLNGYPTTSYTLQGEVLPKYVVGNLVLGGGALGWIPVLVDNHTNKWRGFDQYEIDGHTNFGAKLAISDKDGDGIEDNQDDCPTTKGLAAFNGCPDSDGDGIKDSDDVCPSTPGLAKYKGCADTDGDGIPDNLDKCPNEAGTVRGCPKKLDDKDGDGVEDSKDKCPNIAGLAKHDGCPDSDGDGIADNVDKCPTEAGIASNSGCPEVKEEVKEVMVQAMEGLFFKSGSSVIEKKSYLVLDNIAEIMKKNSSYNLSISGYTDNTGSESGNLRISKARAAAAKKYLVNKGVNASRLISEGYGIANPRATNDTPEGRALNRRVEFKVVF